MHKHVSKPIFDFNFIKKYYFSKFKCPQNCIINQILLFKNCANFRELQFYPLKMNLVLEIRTMLTQKAVGMFFSDSLLFPK